MDFKLLGPLQVVDDSARPVPLGGPTRRAALAALLTRSGEFVSTDELIEAIWPLDRPANPRRALQVVVSRLRNIVGQQRIVSGSGGYALMTMEDAIDGRQLEDAAIGRGDPCAALDLWRGQPLDEVADWPPARHRAAYLAHLRSKVAIDCAERRLDAGLVAEAVATLDPLLDDNPFDEKLWMAYMRALASDGRQADALEAGATLRATLLDSFGTSPSPEFVRMERDIHRHRLTSSPPGDGGDRAVPGMLGELAARRLVGREQELKELSDRWASAAHGTSGLVLVTGEPGIGKTHLAAALASKISAEGGLVLFGASSPQGAAMEAFGEAIERRIKELTAIGLSARQRTVLARATPLLGEPSPPTGDADRDRADFSDALTTVLGRLARRSPILLVLDDLHWAGRSTYKTLVDILRSAPRAGLLIVATARDVPPDSSSELDELVAELLRRSHTSELPLGGLDGAALAELLGKPSQEDLVHLMRRTAGSPLFATQLAGASPDARLTREDGLTKSIERRVRRLGVDVLPALRTAAIIGERFELSVLLERHGRSCEGAVGTPAAVNAVSVAERARLLQPADANGQTMRFHHALVADALAVGCTTIERANEHAALADVLSDFDGGTDGPRSGRIAWHMSNAGPLIDVDVCVSASRSAARRAVAAAANAEGARYLELPLNVDGLDTRVRCELLVEKAEFEGAAGMDAQSIRTATRAAELAVDNGWDELLRRSALSHAPTSGRWVYPFDNEGLAPLALAATTRPKDGIQQARLELRDACFRCEEYPVDHRRRICDRALAVLRSEASPHDLRLGLADAFWALQNALDPPFDLYEEMIARGQTNAEPKDRWWAAMAQHALDWYRHDLVGFSGAGVSWRALSTTLGDAERYWALVSTSAGSAIAGRREATIDLLTAAAEQGDKQTIGMWSGNAPTQLWLTSVLVQDWTIVEDRDDRWPDEPVDVAAVVALLGDLRHLARIVGLLGTRPPPWRATLAARGLNAPAGNLFAALGGLWGISLDDRQLVTESYARLEPLATAMAGAPWNPFPVTHFVLGRFSQYLGHPDTAQAHFAESEVLHERYGSPALVALSERALAETP